MADFRSELAHIAASYHVATTVTSGHTTVHVSAVTRVRTWWVREDARPVVNGQDHVVMYRGHVSLILLGLVIACLLTYAYGPLVHLAPAIASLPAFAQEAFDRIFKF